MLADQEYFIRILMNTEDLLIRCSETIASQIGIYCEVEGFEEEKEKYLTTQIWSLNTVKAISSNVSFTNGGL